MTVPAGSLGHTATPLIVITDTDTKSFQDVKLLELTVKQQPTDAHLQ